MKLKTIIAAIVTGGLLILAAHNVAADTSDASRVAAGNLMHGATFERPGSFDDEVDLIRAVQTAVLRAAPIDKGLPEGAPRELPDLIRAGYGLCYDRSRAIETVLRFYGFETRHASVYATDERSAVEALLTRQSPSHAVSEVLTQRGWMLVDSNAPWLGLKDGQPVDLAHVAAHPSGTAGATSILGRPFTWIYGLYSRHGRFYAPFTPIPDVSWAELLYNTPLR